jgi:hypothetical protein
VKTASRPDHHGGNVQVITAPDGWPIWVSAVRPGREHDTTSARAHGLVDALNQLAATLGVPTLTVGYEDFVVITSLGVIAPLVVYLVTGERAQAVLGHWRDWAAQHIVGVTAVLFFVFGLNLAGDGISVLAA